MAFNVYQRWVVTILVAIITIVNVWAVIYRNEAVAERRELKRRVDCLEKDVLTKQDLETIKVYLGKAIDARFDKFEIYLQDKYKIKSR